MRRALVTVLAVPALLLSACGGDDPEVVDAPSTTAEATSAEETTSEEPTTDEATSEEPTTDEAAEETTSEDAAEETTSDDGEGSEGETEGGEDGQAAADRTKEWLVAFVNAEEEVCDMMLDLSSEGPMKESETDYDICTETFPTQAAAIFDAETAGIIESMEINGADVDGDTAIVDKDNFSALFAEGMGDDVITLQKIDDEWYVDMNASFN